MSQEFVGKMALVTEASKGVEFCMTAFNSLID